MLSILDLPEDIILALMSRLSPLDLHELAQTCKELRYLAGKPLVWRLCYERMRLEMSQRIFEHPNPESEATAFVERRLEELEADIFSSVNMSASHSAECGSPPLDYTTLWRRRCVGKLLKYRQRVASELYRRVGKVADSDEERRLLRQAATWLHFRVATRKADVSVPTLSPLKPKSLCTTKIRRPFVPCLSPLALYWHRDSLTLFISGDSLASSSGSQRSNSRVSDARSTKRGSSGARSLPCAPPSSCSAGRRREGPAVAGDTSSFTARRVESASDPPIAPSKSLIASRERRRSRVLSATDLCVYVGAQVPSAVLPVPTGSSSESSGSDLASLPDGLLRDLIFFRFDTQTPFLPTTAFESHSHGESKSACQDNHKVFQEWYSDGEVQVGVAYDGRLFLTRWKDPAPSATATLGVISVAMQIHSDHLRTILNCLYSQTRWSTDLPIGPTLSIPLHNFARDRLRVSVVLRTLMPSQSRKTRVTATVSEPEDSQLESTRGFLPRRDTKSGSSTREFIAKLPAHTKPASGRTRGALRTLTHSTATKGSVGAGMSHTTKKAAARGVKPVVTRSLHGDSESSSSTVVVGGSMPGSSSKKFFHRRDEATLNDVNPSMTIKATSVTKTVNSGLDEVGSGTGDLRTPSTCASEEVNSLPIRPQGYHDMGDIGTEAPGSHNSTIDQRTILPPDGQAQEDSSVVNSECGKEHSSLCSSRSVHGEEATESQLLGSSIELPPLPDASSVDNRPDSCQKQSSVTNDKSARSNQPRRLMPNDGPLRKSSARRHTSPVQASAGVLAPTHAMFYQARFEVPSPSREELGLCLLDPVVVSEAEAKRGERNFRVLPRCVDGCLGQTRWCSGLPWKADAFRGVFEDGFVLDVSAWDPSEKTLVWAASAAVRMVEVGNDDVYAIEYCDRGGALFMMLERKQKHNFNIADTDASGSSLWVRSLKLRLARVGS
eukprot:Rmarinus@m.29320